MAQPAMQQDRSALLELRDLHVSFATRAGDVPAVRGVDLSLRAGETLAVVGESGSGKTVSALAVIGLIDPPGRVVRGSVWFDGVELTALPPAELRAVRGRRIGMIFQEPMTSLNPVFSVGDQIAEVLRVHLRMKPKQARSDRSTPRTAGTSPARVAKDTCRSRSSSSASLSGAVAGCPINAPPASGRARPAVRRPAGCRR